MATAKAPKAETVEVKVIGQGTLAGNGYPFLLVTSASEFGRVHVVAYSYEGAFVGSRAQCDCMAAQYGKSCKHVLVARAWLAVSPVETEKAVNDAAAPIVKQLLEIAETVRDLGSRAPASHPGDTAMMRRSNRAFSLLK